MGSELLAIGIIVIFAVIWCVAFAALAWED